MRAAAIVLVFGAATVLSSAALVAVLVAQPFVPAVAAPAAHADTASVVSSEFDDARDVVIQTTAADPIALISPAGGRVTAFECLAGGQVASGSAPMSVDGRPVLALSSTVPWWRDVPFGGRGADVDALHTELTRLGMDVSQDGPSAGQATFDAFRAVSASVGIEFPSSGSIPLTSAMWLPAPTVTIGACEMGFGEFVVAGQQVASSAPSLADARVISLPETLAPGRRVLEVGSAVIDVDASGVVADPAARAMLQATSEYATAQAAGADGTIKASLVLAETIPIVVVPPGSIAVSADSRGCVRADGRVRDVEIVGSQLGQSYVTFEDADPPRSVSLEPPEFPCP